MLSTLGLQVYCAHSGQEALDILEAHQEIAVVLMDIHMPGMNGFQTTNAIRQLGGSFAEVPIIAVTANMMEKIGRASCRERVLVKGEDGGIVERRDGERCVVC